MLRTLWTALWRVAALVAVLQLLSILAVQVFSQSVVVNDRALFGLIHRFDFIIVLAVIASFILVRSWHEMPGRSFQWGLLLIVSGGLSNLLDRLIHGGVIDIFRFFDLFIFNAADLLITIGVGMILLTWWQTKEHDPGADHARKRDDSLKGHKET